MLRISFRTEPFWLDLPHGVRLQVRPPGTAVILAAGADLAAGPMTSPGAKSRRDLAADAGTAPTATSDAGPPAGAPADSGRLAFACAVARAAILDWEGVADAEGAPLPLSSAAVDALMAHWPVFAAFERLYLQPALLVVAEGNA
jgi:hypothetical protein